MSRIRIAFTVAVVSLASAGGAARAQTTQPTDATSTTAAAPATWSDTVATVAKATEKGDVPAVAAALPRDAVVRCFESSEPAGARMLVDAAAGWKLLGAHAYEFPPVALASDIATDVKVSDLVPEADKRKIIPLDDNEAARANNTAADWVAQTLGAERDALVGVAVFWNTKANRPTFILMKGQRYGDTYAVKLAVYGDPMPRRPSAAAR